MKSHHLCMDGCIRHSAVSFREKKDSRALRPLLIRLVDVFIHSHPHLYLNMIQLFLVGNCLATSGFRRSFCLTKILFEKKLRLLNFSCKMLLALYKRRAIGVYCVPLMQYKQELLPSLWTLLTLLSVFQPIML